MKPTLSSEIFLLFQLFGKTEKHGVVKIAGVFSKKPVFEAGMA
jgi:hypothetical protein